MRLSMLRFSEKAKKAPVALYLIEIPEETPSYAGDSHQVGMFEM
jgi:hypothetical protein